MSTPLDNYQRAIENLEANPTREAYSTALEAHLECIAYSLLKAPWYAAAYRGWRFKRLQARHVHVGNSVGEPS